MVGALLRVILVVVLVVGVAAFFLGYQWGGGDTVQPALERPVGTSGSVDVEDARDVGAEVGGKVAAGVNEAQRATANAAITAKIKSKMALDDTVDAAEIDVDSSEGVVRLSGRVNTDAERMKALELARETEGVSRVEDNLVVTHR
jgi:osmotically-inducible protein OsmY